MAPSLEAGDGRGSESQGPRGAGARVTWRDPDTEEMFPGLGEIDRSDRFDRVNDEEMFQNSRF